ncbi:MAG: 2-dehydropantoate 2-reductase [Comamonadaceae bacterium]|nr:2-dehydropantoate 2-reductase [Rubrivivax sp.]NLZ42098.1 2-dehydropantoate 2-reductase [Comamonadaceae bacterium]
MKVCIVGLGAVGGLLAGKLGSRLPVGALELSALARGATLAAVRAQGLVLESEDGRATVPLAVADEPAALGVQDLVVLAVKGPALAAAAPAVAALCAPHTRVLSAMNGVPWWFFDGLGAGPAAGMRLDSVDPGGIVRRHIAPARVIGCVVHVAARTPAPGVVCHTGGQGLVVGNAVGAADDSLHALAGLLERAGFGVTRSPRVQRDLWFKLWGNMTMNPVSALTGATCDRILDDELVRGLCSAVMREAQALGAAFGIPIEQQPEERHAVTRKLGAIRTSMLQDLDAGRPLELDALLGAVREIALQLGIATPNVDALFGLTRLMARTRGLYPAAD